MLIKTNNIKLLFVLLLIVVLTIIVSGAVNAESCTTYLGDVNLDGKVTSKDATLISQMVNGKRKDKVLADINQDGKVTSKDTTLAKNIANGKSTGTKVDIYVDGDKNVSILYKQNDTANKNIEYKGRYNNGTYITTWNGKEIYGATKSSNPKLGANGCGPTSCSIVATNFGKLVTPKNLVNGNKKCYSTSEDIKAYFKSIGLKTSELKRDAETYAKAIKNGKKLIVLVGTSSKYSTVKGKIGNKTLGDGTFHWYTILDYKIENGTYKFYVADPYLWSGKANCGWMNFNTLTGIYKTIAIGE